MVDLKNLVSTKEKAVQNQWNCLCSGIFKPAYLQPGPANASGWGAQIMICLFLSSCKTLATLFNLSIWNKNDVISKYHMWIITSLRSDWWLWHWCTISDDVFVIYNIRDWNSNDFRIQPHLPASANYTFELTNTHFVWRKLYAWVSIHNTSLRR